MYLYRSRSVLTKTGSGRKCEEKNLGGMEELQARGNGAERTRFQLAVYLM
jgi:hypothetical protein